MKKIYIVTNTESGWDCVVGVFDSDKVSFDELNQKFNPDSAYIIHIGYLKESLDECD